MKLLCFLCWCMLALSNALADEAMWQLLVSSSGAVKFHHRGTPWAEMRPGLFEDGWRFASVGAGKPGERVDPNDVRGTIRTPGGAEVVTRLRLVTGADGTRFHYTLTPKSEVRLNSLHVSLGGPTGRFIGGAFVVDGKRSAFPAAFDQVHLFSGTISRLEIQLADGDSLNWEFDRPTPVLVQDDRQWGDSFSVRIGPQMTPAQTWGPGRSLEVGFELFSPQGLVVEVEQPVTITAGPQWLPLDVDLDIEPGSALDFSQVIPRHRPAGKFGRVVVGQRANRGRFVFEQRPDEPARFYGVNLCFTGQYLEHDEAERLAERLYRLGYNTVRFHHYESVLIEGMANSTTLNARRLDQLDYLFAELKKRGIYVTTDLFVSRRVPAKELWDGATGAVEMNEYKMAVLVMERAWENYAAFARALLDHRNPYTGLRYADDPSLAWLSLVNEGNPGNYIRGLSERLRPEWTRAWNRWLSETFPDKSALQQAMGRLTKEEDPARGTVRLPHSIDDGPRGRVLTAFFADVDAKFLARTRHLLRDQLGCRALLTNQNAWTNPVAGQLSRRQYDYVDDHFYVDHPQFLERPWRLPSRCANSSPVAAGAPGGRANSFLRLFDKPFTLSEFNYSGPGRYRGVGGILTGALGALQDWSAIWRFAYSHNRDNVLQPKPAGYFDMACDPLGLASDRASLCLFLRGDMKPARHSVAVVLPPQELAPVPVAAHRVAPAWRELAWMVRVGSTLEPGAAEIELPLTRHKDDGRVRSAYDRLAGSWLHQQMLERGWIDGNAADEETRTLQSANLQLTIKADDDVLVLDTPRTAGGFAPPGKRIETRAVTVDVAITPATVWVSSLDGRPISESKRLLVTHLTDLQNTGARYASRARQVLLAWGGLPHVVRAGRANVRIRQSGAARIAAYSLAVNGRRTGPASAEVADGDIVLHLDVDDDGKGRMLYELVVD